jgi:cytidylate kinase
MPLVTSIAIDGPAGSGKSTIAKMLSSATGLPYLSTGEMYRAVALCALRAGASLDNEREVLASAAAGRISAQPDGKGGFKILCAGEDVTGLLRSVEVSRASSPVAVHAGVRSLMVSLQRGIAEATDVIMDGRDIGTVVLRESKNKVYLDASPEERARRRLSDFNGAGLSYEQVLKDILERDMRDSTRTIDPLRPSPDAMVLDTTDMTPEEVVEAVLSYINRDSGGGACA